MTTYRLYREARDTAWRALLRLEEKRLPVDAEALARRVGAQVHPWPDEKENPRLAQYAGQAEGACVSLCVRGQWHLFLRGGLREDEKRFAVAHELGHLLLGHETRRIAPGVRRFASGENAGDVIAEPCSAEDYAADIFASRLLAPACLLHETGTVTAEGIAALCGLPPLAASQRAERMALLSERGVFYLNPLEKKVRDAFAPWLEMRTEEKGPGPALQAASLALPSLPRNAGCGEKPKRKRRLRRWPRWLGIAAAAAALILLFLLGRGP